MSPPRIYLDNAATSWPKPPAVYEAVDRYQRELGAPGGRSAYADAVAATALVERARRGVARLIGAEHSRQVALGYSGTDVLNLAIRGVLRPGDHVIATDAEHNSVLRPLRALVDQGLIETSYARCDAAGFVDPDELQRLLRPTTRLVAVVHASNVTGAIQPIGDVRRVLADHQALLLVDAAQTLGHVPLDVEASGVDLLAAPAHKGLLGPLGTGFLYIRPGVERLLEPLRYGGNGSQCDDDRQPEELPDKYESGNHNLPGLAGLAAALDVIEAQGVAELAAHHARLTTRLLDGLAGMGGVTVYGPPAGSRRTSVVSVNVDDYDPQELAALIEATHGVQCRAGLHCAPRMHAALGTTARGGAVRLSLGFATTDQDVDAALHGLDQAASATISSLPARNE